MNRQRLPNRRLHVGQTFEYAGVEYVMGVGRYPDGRIGELFLATKRHSGTAADAVARDSSILASLALQHGASLDELRRAMTRDGGGRASSAVGAALDIIAGED